MRPPVFADKCAHPWIVRGFTIAKLLFLLLLVAALLLASTPTIESPTLELPLTEVLFKPALDGSGTPGSRVEVISNNQFLGLTEVGQDGRWQLDPPSPFVPGVYDLEARAVDEDGQVIATGPEGRGRLTVVGLPTVDISAADDAEDQVPLRLFGTGTPASTLQVVHNLALLEPVIVDSAGNWSVPLTVPVPSENEFYVQLLSGRDLVLGRTDTITYDISAEHDNEPGPAADLTIESVRFDDPIRAESLGFIAGWLDLTGNGRPGRLVEVYREESIVGEPGTIDADGRWALRLFVILRPGDQTFTARMKEQDGSLSGEEVFIVSIPSPPSLSVEGGMTDVEDVLLSGKARPDRQLTLTLNGELFATVQSNEQGSWHYQTRLQPGDYVVLALDGLLESEPGELTVVLAAPVILGQSTDEDGRLVSGLYGSGRPETRLEILQDGTVIGQASVDSEGNWRCTCTLPPGEQTLSVREIEEPIRASQPRPIQVFNPSPPFEPVSAGPDAPPFSCPEDSLQGQIVGTQYIIGCGESLNIITYRLGVTSEALLAYNPQLSDPPQFYFGQLINIPQTAGCFDDPG